MATGEKRWYIIRFYLAPGNNTTIQDVEADMAERPKGAELIFVGDFNMGLEKTGGQVRDKDIAAVVATVGLEDLTGRFLLG